MERGLVFLMIAVDGVMVAVGQFFIRAGMLRITKVVEAPFSQPGRVIADMLRSPYIWAGVGISLLCFVLWAFILAKAPLMTAGPLMNAVFYVALVCISVWALGEQLSSGKLIGIVLLLGAITLISRETGR